MENLIHIIPLNDLRDHSECDKCWCKPDLNDNVCIHHSMDQREKYETGELKYH